jgi:hypothetical protein
MPRILPHGRVPPPFDRTIFRAVAGLRLSIPESHDAPLARRPLEISRGQQAHVTRDADDGASAVHAVNERGEVLR